jgi:hypothetical protein
MILHGLSIGALFPRFDGVIEIGAVEPEAAAIGHSDDRNVSA